MVVVGDVAASRARNPLALQPAAAPDGLACGAGVGRQRCGRHGRYQAGRQAGR